MVEEYTKLDWDNKKDDVRILKAIVIKLEDYEIALQGDYMIPLINIIKGNKLNDKLVCPDDEFIDDIDTKSQIHRYLIELK